MNEQQRTQQPDHEDNAPHDPEDESLVDKDAEPSRVFCSDFEVELSTRERSLQRSSGFACVI
jgi:hypothetical protein